MIKTEQMTWTTADIVAATGGERLSGEMDRSFTGISIDSRRIAQAEIFIGIKGKTYDGHRFVADVIKKGIGGVVVSRDKIGELPLEQWMKKKIVCVAVPDTIKALGDLAAFHRKRSAVSVLAVTGSNGKTSTKQMTASVLSQRFCTLSSRGNFNNEIGLSLSLLNLKTHHRWAVLELGINHPGEIERLAEICVPDVGVITNIGPVHLEGLGSIKGVIRAKGALLKTMGAHKTALLNADDKRVMGLAKTLSLRVLLFGLSENAAIRAVAVKEKDQGICFTLILPDETVFVDLQTPGRFMVSNAAAAAASGYLLGLSAAEIKAGLENFRPVQGRMNVIQTKRGVHIIDDTYNANPDSMKAATATLNAVKKKKRGVFVAGDMFELGDFAEAMHREIGAVLAKSDIARLYVTGELSGAVAAGARSAGMDALQIMIGSKDDIFQDLTEYLAPGDWVMIKGSRGMAMEQIVNRLKEWGQISG